MQVQEIADNVIAFDAAPSNVPVAVLLTDQVGFLSWFLGAV